MVITLVLLSNCSSTDSPGPTTATEQVVAPSFPEELPAVAEPSTDRWNFLRDVNVKNVVFENLVQIEPFIRFNGADEIYLNNQISDENIKSFNEKNPNLKYEYLTVVEVTYLIPEEQIYKNNILSFVDGVFNYMYEKVPIIEELPINNKIFIEEGQDYSVSYYNNLYMVHSSIILYVLKGVNDDNELVGIPAPVLIKEDAIMSFVRTGHYTKPNDMYVVLSSGDKHTIISGPYSEAFGYTTSLVLTDFVLAKGNEKYKEFYRIIVESISEGLSIALMDEYRKVVEIPGTDNYIENAINSLENFDSLIYGFVREGYDWVSSFDTVEEAYNAFIDSPEQFIQDVGLDKYELTEQSQSEKFANLKVYDEEYGLI